ncbi:phage terminase small subunit [Thiolinea disciformis]|uniref:phage terminase small subunit n=1 Tax=Thiolinea disciformis TaxID=125614 RepID=UPI000362F700|nr:phage terminase small subunit [Thiolinea disciformis]
MRPCSSLAARHRQRVETIQTALRYGAGETSVPEGNYYRSYLAKLEVDKARLAQIRSREQRLQVKRELVPLYRDYLQAALNEPSGHHDEILVTWLIWALDVGEWALSLALCRHALQYRLNSPKGFTRNLPEIIAEEWAEHVLAESDPACWTDALLQLHTWLEPFDMADPVRAKWLSVCAQVIQPEQPDQALAWYERAYALHPKARWKRIITTLRATVEVDHAPQH